MKQKLTDKQLEIASNLREILKTPTNEAWGAFVDVVRSLAVVIEGVESLAHPQDMQERFSAAWSNFAKLWASENNRIIGNCVGGPQQLQSLKNHPKAEVILRRIVHRIVEQHGNFTPGMDVAVDVQDILLEETGEIDGIEVDDDH